MKKNLKIPLIPVHNRELATLFGRMADCYRYLGPEERFRANAYAGAAQTLRNMSEPVDKLAGDIRKLDELKSVGTSIAGKITEYLRTGKVATFEKLKKKVPYRLLELMDIEGFGPATLRVLHENRRINTKEELIEALQHDKLAGLPGFGAKKIEKLKQALKLESAKKRLPLKKAEAIAGTLLKAVKAIPGVEQATIAGSLRRKKETIGDIDIVLTAAGKNRKKIVNAITSLPQVETVIAAGSTRASVVLKRDHVQADMRIVHDDEYGAALFYFTGSKDHNIRIRTLARQKGWKLNEYGVFEIQSGRRIAGETEEEIYALFGLPWIPPEKRTGGAELDAAR